MAKQPRTRRTNDDQLTYMLYAGLFAGVWWAAGLGSAPVCIVLGLGMWLAWSSR